MRNVNEQRMFSHLLTKFNTNGDTSSFNIEIMSRPTPLKSFDHTLRHFGNSIPTQTHDAMFVANNIGTNVAKICDGL